MFVWPEGGSTKRNEDEEKVEEEDKDFVDGEKDDMDKKWKCVDESEEDKGRDGVEKVRTRMVLTGKTKTGIVLIGR